MGVQSLSTDATVVFLYDYEGAPCVYHKKFLPKE